MYDLSIFLCQYSPLTYKDFVTPLNSSDSLCHHCAFACGFKIEINKQLYYIMFHLPFLRLNHHTENAESACAPVTAALARFSPTSTSCDMGVGDVVGGKQFSMTDSRVPVQKAGLVS